MTYVGVTSNASAYGENRHAKSQSCSQGVRRVCVTAEHLRAGDSTCREGAGRECAIDPGRK